MLKFAVIGYGHRIGGIVDKLVNSGEATLTAVMDVDLDAARAKAAEKGYENVTYYTDAEEMLKAETLDGVLIGTRCTLHTAYALLVAKYNLPLFLEKPVSTTEEDLARLATILPTMNEKTVVSFPLRTSAILLKVKEIVDSGKLGSVEHVQAYNNVPYGRGYYHKWYREEKETGGQWLQKATHDLDYINYLLGGLKPVRICAAKSQRVFGGDEPAGKLCADCDKSKTCLESPYNVKKNGDRYLIGPYCCFAKDVTIEDSGSCILEYETGMHVVYTQNFVARNGAGKRGARLIGFKGTLEFDWVTSKISVFRHQENITEEYRINGAGGSHFGGDQNLVENFIDVMKGIAPSDAPLSEGIFSAKLCLAAKKSSIEHVFVEL
ncbi:MAG: Gfo/Idh/MocA family oxidoreductase [Clostridia bacterium]|nr:Gfo/Idh/MocA family oxidoreductase [Clostridia bacterium]